MATKQPEEMDLDRLRREMETRLKEQDRKIAALEGQINKIKLHINSGPGKRIE
jgi:hypothetical protein